MTSATDLQVGDRVTLRNNNHLAPGERDAGGNVIRVWTERGWYEPDYQVAAVRWDATRVVPEIVTQLEAEHLKRIGAPVQS